MENETLETQIERLAQYLMDKWPTSLKGEGAIDTAIDLLKTLESHP